MLMSIFQGVSIPSQLFPLFIAGLTFGMMALSWIPLLKIGLIISKAEVKSEWKWVLASSFIQAGLSFFIMSPIFINMFSDFGTGEGPGDTEIFGLIFGLLALGMIINLQVINVIHHIGMKRALLIFVLEIIPVIIIMGVVFGTQFGGYGP
jgi:hypothetical protein